MFRCDFSAIRQCLFIARLLLVYVHWVSDFIQAYAANLPTFKIIQYWYSAILHVQYHVIKYFNARYSKFPTCPSDYLVLIAVFPFNFFVDASNFLASCRVLCSQSLET